MEYDCLKLLPMVVSAVAACVSVYFANLSRRTQIKLLENRHDIELISEVIELLKSAKAIQEYSSDFGDTDFLIKSDLSIIPSKIAQLLQNKSIKTQISREDWNLPITKIEDKISQLSKARGFLLT